MVINETKVAVLGKDGVTGKSVLEVLQRLPEFVLVDVEDAEYIVVSPGIPPRDFPQVQGEIISEIEFAYRLFHRSGSSYVPQLIAVTGTNGKSTVTSLLAHILDCPYSGNIGVPLVNFVDDPKAPPVIVVELSSFQLKYCSTFCPELALVLNVTPDHLDWHLSMEDYSLSKSHIFRQQTNAHQLLYYGGCANTVQLVKDAKSHKIVVLDEDVPSIKEMMGSLEGHHNGINVCFALKVAAYMGCDQKKVVDKISTFQPLAHRLEKVATVNQVSFYNDSKATNPDATIKSIDVFDRPIHLILCGEDKQLELVSFVKDVQKVVKTVTVFGGISEKLMTLSRDINAEFPIFRAERIEDALALVVQKSVPYDIVLFSPSSSSYDQFKGFVHRGECFKDWVYAYEGR
ncbi:UDP-N-acetylmuramoyl-L-alanine--D-glutamate ligase [Candidatus Marinamargulisbacteria bacterium SCGC AG-439-L15]|nr:UDP-N-acetylmuramoyl-L-alanine--D-glutamate ligase [Candidatus Marinamargulisbacteria bacterium SCGC AG-439-L15]